MLLFNGCMVNDVEWVVKYGFYNVEKFREAQARAGFGAGEATAVAATWASWASSPRVTRPSAAAM